MPLFEVAIIETPTPNEEDEGKQERLVLPPTPIIAANREAAIASAASSVAGKFDPQRSQVLVRPFC